MFSEYASRFLAQSQSRIVPRPDEKRRKEHGRLIQQPGNSRYLPSRSFLQRRPADPYQPGASQFSNFAFGARNSPQQAPLFHSATDDFHEEDDEAEREREIADFYALQRSRRHFGGSQLRDSETDDDDNSPGASGQKAPEEIPQRENKGIRSAWRAPRFNNGGREWFVDPVIEAADDEDELDASSSRTRGKLVDIHLEDTLRSDPDADHHDESPGVGDDDPPSIQRFREQPQSRMGGLGTDSFFISQEASKQALLENPRPLTAEGSYTAAINPEGIESPIHDAFWGQLFLISLACLFATSFLVYLHTSSPPGDKSKWGDTIYLTIHSSFYLLGVYTLVSVFISLLWLALLRSYVRPLVYATIFIVPIILYSFSLYPFISSFRGTWQGSSIQDKVMRFGSFVPFIMATAWIYNVIRSRHAIGKAISILEFSCRILAANPELLILGLGNLVLIVSWTWVWMLMFTRVFLGGHLSGSALFIISTGSWWLGAYFIIVYLWSLGIIAGIQRAVTAATVSQWYFHRLASPAPTSRQIVQAATVHSLTTLFGTICLSRLISLLIRIPLLLLPSRIAAIVSLFAYTLVPAPIATLTDPLSLTYAAIHSQPLATSARGLTQMTNLAPSIATSSLHPRSFSWARESYSPLLSYRLSKLILHAARLMMSLALGFGGWVSTARSLGVPSSGGVVRGSVYAYIVGLIAGTIGWSVLGSIEGVIADIVDASIICWSSEVGTYGREARYCREAGWLFGQDTTREERYSAEP
ncbi:hypothetical protein P175DRAFT_0479402 [Aspergillus ochraceoroseus IBT 24754]|uniref:Protein PNS1 n=2 Tax=Aspergillus ochraceoroseus TaxID=138278 RepID=A0A2T5LXD8_9EURO|nr:uncharacterized protein P175DRAFT_0479402 [Aspergillus ochraceoroseus IBT 24754]KKK24595.1 hypothetical protein AOCH_002956 [Aspergillus ochraceoroseus]PTU20940.1 hypothetical protein P175DRAFT_0479402 [Aspergillus ochraceoroseus IBT 24754]